MSVFDATRYGWNTHLWLTVAGIPVVWGEAVTGKTLPADFPTADGGLVIDGSAAIGTEQIDRERGASVGLAFTFKILDSSTSRDWLRTWSKNMTLTADQPASGAGSTDATVDDSTGWSNGDSMFLGMEAQTIGAVASGTSLTGITRAEAGTLAYDHGTGTTAQVVTDRPRVWRGRQVILYASPVDPAGYVTGTTLAADARQIFKGKLVASPRREADGFVFEAIALDRLVDQSFVGEVTGKAIDTSHKHEVNVGWRWSLSILAVDSTGAEVFAYDLTGNPFEDQGDGDMLFTGNIQDLIVASFDDAVSAASAGADLGSMIWSGKPDPTARVDVVADTNIVRIDTTLTLDGLEGPIERHNTFTGGMSTGVNVWYDTGWFGGVNPVKPFNAFGNYVSPELQALTVELDEGNVGNVPTSGLVEIEGERWSYKQASTSQANLYLGGLARVGSGKLTAADVKTKTVRVLFEDQGTPGDLMLRALMTSGTGERSATYDTLLRGQGYGIHEDDVNVSSFTTSGSPINSLPCKISHAGKSFADLFGGILGLFRRAVVLKPDPDDGYALKLTLVSTTPYGSDYMTSITDADLLSAGGDPVLSVKPAEVPNLINVLRPLPGSDGDADRLTFNDGNSADIVGVVEADYSIPAITRGSLIKIARAAALGQLASDQTLQAVELRVGPWIEGSGGDVIAIETTHPGIWTWTDNPGSIGYDGTALVVGRRVDPITSAVVLTVLLDGSLSVRSLSPAAEILSFGGTAADPSTIAVDLIYLDHFAQSLDEAGGTIEVYHYNPGKAEGAIEQHTVSAAAEVGGNCQLTIDTTSGGHSLVVADRSTLTLPNTNGGDVSTYQNTFAHVDDGTTWG